MDNEFYIISNELFDDSSYGYGEHRTGSYNTGEATYCDGCNLPVSTLKWLPPYEVNVSNQHIGDFIFGTYPGFIVSEKFKLEYEKTALFGLSNFDLTDVYNKNQKYSRKYYYPEITLINAFVNYDFVDFNLSSTCNVCQRGRSIINNISRVEFIEKEIIKEDIFFTTALGQGQIIVSKRFKKFVETEAFKNIEFLKASDYNWNSLDLL